MEMSAARPDRPDESHSVALVAVDPVEPPSGALTLFGTSDPEVALEKMGRIASVLVDVIRDRHLFARISGKDYITCEGWLTLGGMLGVVPVVVWTKQNESGDGYLARVEARTLDGRVVGAAEAECSRSEQKWRDRANYALRSMAQTRAISRALRAPLGQIVVLAGYQPAAVEEMQEEPPQRSKPSAEQLDELRRLLHALEQAEPDTDWPAHCREIAGVPGTMLTRTGAEILIRQLGAELANPRGGCDLDPDR